MDFDNPGVYGDTSITDGLVIIIIIITYSILRDEEGLGLKDIAAEATREMRNQVRREILRFESSRNSS